MRRGAKPANLKKLSSNTRVKNFPRQTFLPFTARSVRKAWGQIVRQRGFGFLDGGCLIFARAARENLHAGKIVTLSRNGKADHYGFELPSCGWGDADGFFPQTRDWIDHYKKREGITEDIAFHPFQMPSGEIPDDERTISEICGILQPKQFVSMLAI